MIIETKQDYEFAMQMVDQFFEAKPGTPAAKHLQLWADAIERYEKIHFPITEEDIKDRKEALEQQMDKFRALARLSKLSNEELELLGIEIRFPMNIGTFTFGEGFITLGTLSTPFPEHLKKEIEEDL